MKKRILSLICAGMLIGSMPLDGAVSKMRAVKCSLSRFHTKFNCTEEEKAVGKKWLVGASVAAALAALAALVVGGVKLAEVQAEKKRQEAELGQAQREKTQQEQKQQEQQRQEWQKQRKTEESWQKTVDSGQIYDLDMTALLPILRKGSIEMDISVIEKLIENKTEDEQKKIIFAFLSRERNLPRSKRPRSNVYRRKVNDHILRLSLSDGVYKAIFMESPSFFEVSESVIPPRAQKAYQEWFSARQAGKQEAKQRAADDRAGIARNNKIKAEKLAQEPLDNKSSFGIIQHLGKIKELDPDVYEKSMKDLIQKLPTQELRDLMLKAATRAPDMHTDIKRWLGSREKDVREYEHVPA